jgi:hypothetical protein
MNHSVKRDEIHLNPFAKLENRDDPRSCVSQWIVVQSVFVLFPLLKMQLIPSFLLFPIEIDILLLILTLYLVFLLQNL